MVKIRETSRLAAIACMIAVKGAVGTWGNGCDRSLFMLGVLLSSLMLSADTPADDTTEPPPELLLRDNNQLLQLLRVPLHAAGREELQRHLDLHTDLVGA